MTPRPRWTMIALGLTLVPLATKVLSPSIAFPFWDSDPLLIEPLAIGLRPAMSVALDAVTLLGAAMLVGASAVGQGRLLMAALLLLLGCVPVLWFAMSPTDMDHARIGLSWASAMAAGTAIWLASPSDARIGRVVLGVFGGLVAALTLKGAGQLLIEHPLTVKTFNENKLKIFEAQGWLPDSPMAKGYERRLMQPEATGWFGFSNVFASYAAALAALWAGVTLAVVRARADLPRWHVVAAVLALLASIACVAMADGKGGWAVLIMGLVLVAICAWVTPRVPLFARVMPVALPLLCVLAIAAVIARGVVGERLGELSLLFRSFYFEAAARVFVDSIVGRANPAGADLATVTGFFGTGPAGFKEAYLVYKPSISPEDVASPHSVFFDWTATLGPLGLAWCTLLVWWLVSAGRSVVSSTITAERETDDDAAASATSEFRTLCAIATAASLLAARDSAQALNDVELVSRFGGLMLWCALGLVILRAARISVAGVTLGAVAASAVLATHGQIEQTFSWTGSAGLIVATIAATAGFGLRGRPSGFASGGRNLAGVSFAVALAGLSVAAGWVGLRRVLPWEATLESTSISTWQARDASPQRRFGELVTSAGKLGAFADWPTRREASRLLVTAARSGAPQQLAAECLRLAEVVAVRPIDQDAPAKSAIDALAKGQLASTASKDLAAPASLRINQNAWLALIFETFGRDSRDRSLLTRAAGYAEIAARQDPTAPTHAVRLMGIYTMLGDQERARAAAGECLRRDDLQRLDRLARGMSDADRAMANRLLGK